MTCVQEVMGSNPGAIYRMDILHIYLCENCIVCLTKTKNKPKRGPGWPIFTNSLKSYLILTIFKSLPATLESLFTSNIRYQSTENSVKNLVLICTVKKCNVAKWFGDPVLIWCDCVTTDCCRYPQGETKFWWHFLAPTKLGTQLEKMSS